MAGYREMEIELARLRFRLNFGTAICQDCDGLHAGPDVVATCYQTQECRFTNLRATEKRHLRVIDHLLGET